MNELLEEEWSARASEKFHEYIIKGMLYSQSQRAMLCYANSQRHNNISVIWVVGSLWQWHHLSCLNNTMGRKASLNLYFQNKCISFYFQSSTHKVKFFKRPQSRMDRKIKMRIGKIFNPSCAYHHTIVRYWNLRSNITSN